MLLRIDSVLRMQDADKHRRLFLLVGFAFRRALTLRFEFACASLLAW